MFKVLCRTLLTVAIVISSLLVTADRYSGRAKRAKSIRELVAYQQRAAKLAPWHLDYAADYHQTLISIFAGVPRLRGQALREMGTVSANYLRFHRQSKEGYHLIAITALLGQQPQMAKAYAKHAQKLDPFNPALGQIVAITGG